MKYSLILALSLFFLVSCGNDNDDDRFINGVNAYGQPCNLNQVNGYNNLKWRSHFCSMCYLKMGMLN